MVEICRRFANMSLLARSVDSDQDDQASWGTDDDGERAASAHAVSMYIQDVSQRTPALPRPGPFRPLPSEKDRLDPVKFGNRTMRRPAHFARTDIRDDDIDEEEALVRRANTIKAVKSILGRPGVRRTDPTSFNGGGSMVRWANMHPLCIVLGATGVTMAATLLGIL